MLREQSRFRRSELEPLPKAARKEIIISEANDLAVVFEDSRACEFIMRQGEQLVGDIILGKVESVVPAIEAAFIHIGHEKNGFIHVADLPPSPGAQKKGKPAAIRSGDKLIVQIAKAPTGTKGARLTGRISVPGRYLVFVPHDNRVCISRRIVDSKERERLRRIAFNLKDPGHGLIVRTEAIGASEDELRRDIDELIDRWAEILHVAQVKHAPALLYRDHDLMTRVLRDAVSAETERIVLDSEEGLQRAADLLSGWMPDMVERLHLHNAKDSVMSHYKINVELETALKPTIRLPSGGSIVIEPTEALTCIDVNSGKLTSSKSLQDTVLRTNLEAATEIARQLRLRDIGGVIIIDFISMDFPADRQKVIRHFEEALRPDKSRPQITTQFSEHGLLEVARRRQGQSLLEQLTKPCVHCHGVGRVRNEVFATAAAVAGTAITGVIPDDPGSIVEELIEEPLATELLDAEIEPGAEAPRGPRPQLARPEQRPLFAPAATRGFFADEEGEGDLAAEGESTELSADGEPRRRRRRRRRRGGRNGEGVERMGIGAQVGGQSAVASGSGATLNRDAVAQRSGGTEGLVTEDDYDEFEASPEDIAAYALDQAPGPQAGHVPGSRVGGTARPDALGEGGGLAEEMGEAGRRRRRRRRGRGGRGGGAESGETAGLGQPQEERARPAFGRVPAERGRPSGGRAPAERGRPVLGQGFAERPSGAAQPTGFGARLPRPAVIPEIEEGENPPIHEPAVAESVAPAAVLGGRQLEPVAARAPEAPAKRLPKGVTGFRPVVGPVERTAPYTPRTVAPRPKMEVREVTPGVMQLVAVESATAGSATAPPAVAEAAAQQPEAEAPKRQTRRTGVRKTDTAEAAEIAKALEEASAAKPAAETAEKRPTRRTAVRKAGTPEAADIAKALEEANALEAPSKPASLRARKSPEK